ncbi:MAG: hypothetical protein HDR84_06425 [Bacteroides sp.]|nr:hypothetical protein [Bacteroides sp.]
MTKIIYTLITGTALLGGAVLTSGCSTKGNQVAAEETADQIEQARIAGREAARTFVSKDWRDSLELQSHLIEAGIKRTSYDSLPQQKAAYDSAFISTVRTVRPEVAAQLEKFRNQQ